MVQPYRVMSTKDVANFIATVSFNELPLAVVTQAKVVLRDNLGVLLASHRDAAVEVARRLATAMGGKEESTLIGIGIKVPCNIASCVNALMASTLDMDDGAIGMTGHRGHPGAIIVPSSLAVAERENATGKALIEAIVVGYEVAIRTGWMMADAFVAGTPPPHGSQQVLAGTPGTYGAAAAATKLLKLSIEKIVDTLGIAEAHCPFPSSETIWQSTAMVKEACGWAAMTGVTAALLGEAGFGGPRTIYDLPKYNKKPWETLGQEWEILGLYFKPYATCRCSHAILDGVVELTKEYNLKAGDIFQITVGVASPVTVMANYRPASIWEAQYSIPFAVGAALVDGEVGPGQIAGERLANGATLSQADKVKLVVDPEVNELWPGILGAKIKIKVKDGRKFETFKRYPKGEPQNPLSEQELSSKFMRLARGVVGPNKAEDIARCLSNLEGLAAVNELVEKISYCK